MAKYDITYSCGHKTVLQLYGKHSQREYEISRAETRLCPECYQEAKRREQMTAAAAAAEVNFQNGCVPLKGTPAQIAWAEIIRLTGIEALRKAIVTAQGRLDHPQTAAALPVLAATLEWCEEAASATWWIENRPQTTESAAALKAILLSSPHLTEQVAEFAGITDAWAAKKASSAEKDAMAAYWQQAKTLAAQARHWGEGEVKPWWSDKKDGRHYRLYHGKNCVSWMKERFEDTVKFEGIADTAENRALAIAIWKWANSCPDNKLKRLRIA